MILILRCRGDTHTPLSYDIDLVPAHLRPSLDHSIALPYRMVADGKVRQALSVSIDSSEHRSVLKHEIRRPEASAVL